VDRAAFVNTGDLRLGERVKHFTGTSRVVNAEPLRGEHRVYNLEVHGEHVYRVGCLGLLVHNAKIRFGQKGISPTFRYGEFAGRTIDEVAAGLRSGMIKPEQLPIMVIKRNGALYTLNNRSLMALRKAGMEPTRIVNVTGDKFFECQLTERLAEIGGEVGPDFIPIIRGGGN